MQQEAQFVTTQLPRVQEAMEKTTDPALKNAMTEQVAALKAQIAANNLRQQDQAEQLREAETRLRSAKTEMEALQGELDTLVKRLSPAN